MIKLTPIVTWNRTNTYFSTKRVVESVNKKIQGAENCQSFYHCFCDALPAFANLTAPSDLLTNDFNSFFIEYSNNIVATSVLKNKDTGVEYPIVGNTYGFLYNAGQVGANKYAFKLEWQKVASLISFGNYELTIELRNSISNDLQYIESHCFKLMPFTCDNANGTVRITTEKNGYIENGNDYRTVLSRFWEDQIRFYGKFDLVSHTTEIDNLLLSNRDLEQIQTQIIDNFNLRIDSVVSSDAMAFIKDDLLANKIKIDDYNANNITDYKSKLVYLTSIDDPIKHTINGTYTYNIKMVEFNQSTLKRNY